MFLRSLLIAGYCVGSALCAPQSPQKPQNPWLASLSELDSQVSTTSSSETKPTSTSTTSSTITNEETKTTSATRACPKLPKGVPADIQSLNIPPGFESDCFQSYLATRTKAVSSSSSSKACGKLPKGYPPDFNWGVIQLPPGFESDCLKSYLATRSGTTTSTLPSEARTTSSTTSSTATPSSSSAAATPTSTSQSNSSTSQSSTLSTSTKSSSTTSAATSRSTTSRSTAAATSSSSSHPAPEKHPWSPRISDKSVGPTFQIILSAVPVLRDSATHMVPDADIYDIDLFRTEKKTIEIMHRLNKTVVCYFSGGTYEPNRPDSNQFAFQDKGSRLAQWPSEMWVKTSSAKVRQIITSRIKLAHEKNCDAIDPDNIDAYGAGRGGGLGLTKRDSIDYIRFLSATAAKYNLGLGLKNSLEILSDVRHLVHFAVNEECIKANECNRYRDFIVKDEKPVFHIEYPVGERPKTLSDAERKRWCGDRTSKEVKDSPNFQTVIKAMGLGGWVLYCNGTSATTPVNEVPSRWSTRGNYVLAEGEEPKMSEQDLFVAKQDNYPYDLSTIEVVQEEEIERHSQVARLRARDALPVWDKR